MILDIQQRARGGACPLHCLPLLRYLIGLLHQHLTAWMLRLGHHSDRRLGLVAAREVARRANHTVS